MGLCKDLVEAIDLAKPMLLRCGIRRARCLNCLESSSRGAFEVDLTQFTFLFAVACSGLDAMSERLHGVLKRSIEFESQCPLEGQLYFQKWKQASYSCDGHSCFAHCTFPCPVFHPSRFGVCLSGQFRRKSTRYQVMDLCACAWA